MSLIQSDLPMLDPSTLVPALNPIRVVDGAGLEEVKKYLSTPRPFVFDYEFNVTKGFYRRRARTLQLGDKDVQFIIDLLALVDGDTKKLIHGQGGYRRPGTTLRMYNEEETEFEEAPVDVDTFKFLSDILRPSFQSNQYLKIGHFLEAEYVTSKWCLGLRPWHFYDTFVGERILYNGAPVPQKDFYGLDDLVRRYFGVQISKDEQKTFDLHSPLTDRQEIYTALDIRLPWALKGLQEPRLQKVQLAFTARIENDAIPAFGDMHINGLWVNPTTWKAIMDSNEHELQVALDELDSHLTPIVGEKELPDPERVKKAHEAFKSYDVPSSAEVETTAAIKAAKKSKDTALVEELTQRRAQQQEERKANKQKAKEYYDSIRYLATKGYADEVAKMKGKARINYNSADQVKAALYSGPWGLNEQNMRDLNAKTTLLQHMGIPVVAAYVRVKKVEKLLGTYGERWIMPRDQHLEGKKDKAGHVDPDTGRIHPPFRQLGTDTGRPSCSDPNVLNLPKDTRYRAAFEARKGHMNVTKDCAGQELRILTEISREPAFIEAFNNDEDVHSISTNMISPDLWQSGTIHIPTLMKVENKKTGKVEEVLIPPCAFFHSKDGKRMKCKCPIHVKVRDRYKAFNFGVIYDKSAYSFSIELGVPVEETETMLEGWKTTFSITQEALERLRNDAYERGEARTLGGRRRILTHVTTTQAIAKAEEKWGKPVSKWQIERMKESLISAVKREGGNMPIQGTGADMMKLAMGCGFDPDGNPYLWHILEPEYDSLLENYVYDEMMAETPEEHCEAVGGPDGVGGVISDAIIRAGAQFVTVVPMASEGAIAKSWTK